MRPYEVMVVVDPTLDDGVTKSTVDRATGAIEAAGGSTVRVDRWGRRRLAYEIAHHTDGYYVLIEASLDPEKVSDVDRVLHLADEVIRHKIIRIPDSAAGRTQPVPAPSAEPDPSPQERQRS